MNPAPSGCQPCFTATSHAVHTLGMFPVTAATPMDEYLEELLERARRWHEPLPDEPADDDFDM